MIFFNDPHNDIFELENDFNNGFLKKKPIPTSFAKLNEQVAELENTVFALNNHKNPRLLLPEKTKFRFIKLAILKIIKVYTSIQVHFNDLLVKNLNTQKDVFKEIINYLIKLDEDITILRTQKNKNNLSNYHSFYFQNDSDSLYEHLENVFRGSKDIINERQQKYSKYLKSLKQLSEKYGFLDIGFGRGEFLSVLRQNDLKNISGIDINEKFVFDAKNDGFNVIKRDAISFLSRTSNTYCGISMFHLIEHMPFPEIYDLLKLSYQHLCQSGKIIIETPNPNNLQVSSYSFYYDYTHVTKVPANFLKAIMLYIGFKSLKVIYLSPFNKGPKTKLQELVYGPREYAIIASK